MEGNVDKFGESSMICQTKTIQISTYNYNLADLLICQTFFYQMLETNQFTNVSLHTVVLGQIPQCNPHQVSLYN